MRHGIKTALKTLLIIVIAIAVIVGGYVLYVALSYDRIEDNQKLDIGLVDEFSSKSLGTLKQDTEYTALTYNIGFGAYDHEYSFFMDTSLDADGTEIVGIYSRARSKEAEIENTEADIAAVLKENPDIVAFQEVDIKADRSYDINQVERILSALAIDASVPLTWTYACNFHSAYLFYPLTKPIGKISDSGLLTVSKYEISSAVRRSYPVSDAFPTKFFDLDRCFSVNRMPVEAAEPAESSDEDAEVGEDTGDSGVAGAAGAGAELVFIDTHMSAYDEGGVIRKQQMEMLMKVLSDEYAKGNYVIVAGDFNHAIGGSETMFMHGSASVPDWVAKFDDSMIPAGFSLLVPDNLRKVGTCRDASMPYEKGVNYEVVIDGFIVSDNIEATSHNVNADYLGTDHNPVKLSFKLKAL